MVLRNATGVQDASISMLAVPMQSENSKVDTFTSLNPILSNLILLAYVIRVFTTTGWIVREKELRMRESMRIMGLTELPYWLSWFVYYTCQNTITAFLVWATLSINIFSYSSQWLCFSSIWLYGESLFGEIIFFQALFSKAKYAGIVSAVLYFVFSLTNLAFIETGDPSLFVIMLMSIVP